MTDQPTPKSREWDSAAYHRVSGPQFSWGQKVLNRLSLRGDETVLDAGCGTGRLTKELLQQLPRGEVVAVDLSRNMLQSARQNLGAEPGGRIRFVAADLQDLPFAGCFDGIFSTASFHWVPDHARLFRNLFASLKPGGWLCAQCGGGPNLSRLLERVAVLIKTPKFRPYLGDYKTSWVFSDAETALRRLKSAGFVEVETGVEPAPTQFDTANQFCEFVSKVILHRHLERLPDAGLRDQLMEEVATLAAHDDPPFQLDYWRLNLDGRRP
jgi:trans-aconitate 2-methyltransferase